MHIIEEMVLFHNSQPVQHIELDTEKVDKCSAKKENKPACLINSAINPFVRFMEDSMSH